MFSKWKRISGDNHINQEDHIEEEFQLLHEHLSGLGISEDFMLEMRDVFQLFDKVWITSSNNKCNILALSVSFQNFTPCLSFLACWIP